jgi:hypothetical protein
MIYINRNLIYSRGIFKEFARKDPLRDIAGYL